MQFPEFMNIRIFFEINMYGLGNKELGGEFVP